MLFSIIYYLMEQDNPLQTLPRREYNLPVKFSKAQTKTVVTNFYEIKLGNKNNTIYQYAFDASPQIPQDSKELLFQLVKSIKKELKEKVGFITASGLIIWGTKSLNIPLTIKTDFKYDQTTYSFQVLLKPTKTLDILELMKTNDGTRMVLQMFNIRIKGILREKKMTELARGKYFDPKQVQVKQVGLNILRGFKFTICPLKSGLTLQIDVCSRVFRSNNLLEEINNLSRDQIEALKDKLIITRYGRIRTYSIKRFQFNLNPKSQFYHDKSAGKISFAKYYEQSYGLKVRVLNQPLIEVVLRQEKKMNKKGELEKTQILGFLLPEFVSLTGMSDQQKANYNTMKEIAPYTKLTPDQRQQQIDRFNNQVLRNSEVDVSRPTTVTAYQLNDPQVRLASNNLYRAKGGDLNFKDKVKTAIQFKDWVVVYSQGKNPKYDDSDADNLVDLIVNASQTFGIKFEKPGFITCDPTINSWKQEIKSDIEKNGKPLILVLLFNPNQEKFYGDLKRYITCELKLPCQAIRKRTVGKQSKNPMSAASKIIIQMNQKAGGITWEVKRNEYFQKKKSMYGAFSISKGKKGFTLAFVGTLNSENTKVINYCKTGYKRKEDIPKADFDTIFLNWAKSYVQENKVAPSIIMVYREGLSIPQIKVQLGPQIQALNGVIKKIGEKTKTVNYNPEVLYVTVNKKINTRFFDTNETNISQGKFLPKVFNPASGTVLFDDISTENQYDFHLAAQRVTQGTCTPTQFIVVYNQSKIPQESLAQFTYEQCFNYYNWQGAVKVPAAMQCADKLAKLVGESIQANVTDGDVLKSYFFL